LAREGTAPQRNRSSRAEALAALFPQATVTSFDAARIASHVPIAERHRDEPAFARSASGHADNDAAARHLLSALATLRPGGRLVAIMPDGFSNHGRTRETFARVLQGSHVRLHLRLEEPSPNMAHRSRSACSCG
jgi:uncharacterized protein (DUF1501 family)